MMNKRLLNEHHFFLTLCKNAFLWTELNAFNASKDNDRFSAVHNFSLILKVHHCRFENLPVSSSSYKNTKLNNSRILRIKNAKFSGCCFYMNTNIYWDFQICISVPLSSNGLVPNCFCFSRWPMFTNKATIFLDNGACRRITACRQRTSGLRCNDFSAMVSLELLCCNGFASMVLFRWFLFLPFT